MYILPSYAHDPFRPWHSRMVGLFFQNSCLKLSCLPSWLAISQSKMGLKTASPSAHLLQGYFRMGHNQDGLCQFISTSHQVPTDLLTRPQFLNIESKYFSSFSLALLLSTSCISVIKQKLYTSGMCLTVLKQK